MTAVVFASKFCARRTPRRPIPHDVAPIMTFRGHYIHFRCLDGISGFIEFSRQRRITVLRARRRGDLGSNGSDHGLLMPAAVRTDALRRTFSAVPSICRRPVGKSERFYFVYLLRARRNCGVGELCRDLRITVFRARRRNNFESRRCRFADLMITVKLTVARRRTCRIIGRPTVYRRTVIVGAVVPVLHAAVYASSFLHTRSRALMFSDFHRARSIVRYVHARILLDVRRKDIRRFGVLRITRNELAAAVYADLGICGKNAAYGYFRTVPVEFGKLYVIFYVRNRISADFDIAGHFKHADSVFVAENIHAAAAHRRVIVLYGPARHIERA